jgi:hypothetical protein
MDELLMAKLFTVSPTLSLYSLDYRRFRKFQLARKSSVAHTKLQYYSLQRKYVF